MPLTGAAAQTLSRPASITALPFPGSIVSVDPPLSCRGPRLRYALLLDVEFAGTAPRQPVPASKLPPLSTRVACGAWEQLVMMSFAKTRVPEYRTYTFAI